jgi:hypothetical protein
MSDVRRLTAFLDASVLYSAPIRDLLMHLAVQDLFQARWSDRVHDEWIAALLHKRRDLTPAQLARTRRLMDENINDASVTGYEHMIDQLMLPDTNDRHVLAAAIHTGANIIVTANVKDFPAEMLVTHGITALHPDTFICRILENEPDAVVAGLRKLHRDLKNPPIPLDELLTGFARIGLVETVAELRRLMDQ